MIENKNDNQNVVKNDKITQKKPSYKKSAMQVKRYRAFSVVSYLDEVTFVQLLHRHIQGVRSYCYMLHDRETEHDVHLHCLLYTYHAHSFSALRKWFEHTSGQNTFVQAIKDDTQAYYYLDHSEHDEKVQYDMNNLVKYNYKGCEYYNSGDESFNILEQVLDEVSLREIAFRYGKDFIFKYRAYKELAEDIKFQESRIDFKNKTDPAFETKIDELPF